MKKIKLLIEATIVITVVLALVLPSSAVVTNTITVEGKDVDPLWRGKKQVEIEEVKTWNKDRISFAATLGTDIRITGWEPGDDLRPSITKTSDGSVFITWEYNAGLLSSEAGFTYNADPLDEETWWNNGVILGIEGIEIMEYPDTAICEHPELDLFNVFLGVDTEETGGMFIPDYTDYNTWEIYTWTGGSPEPEYAAVSDGGWYEDINYPGDVIGPFNFYIYHEIYAEYDIPSCPVCFHNGIDSGQGVGYFDGQSDEKTAPAADPDMINLADRFHTVLYNEQTSKVIWKKIVPAEEPDYEFTPYQATIADGTHPSISAYGTNVAVVYVDEGQVKCVYSEDDGDTWSAPVVIATGQYPNICASGNSFIATYIESDNLYYVISSDGGETWGAPNKLNDVDGTVVAEENSVDIHSGGIAWVDNRNDDCDIYYELLPAPSIPTLNGPSKGKPNTAYTFKVKSVEPEEKDVYYWIDWGDGTNTGWQGPYASDTQQSFTHKWTTEELFTIRAKAKNEEGAESDWATHTLSTPKNKAMKNIWLEKLPHISILKILLDLLY